MASKSSSKKSSGSRSSSARKSSRSSSSSKQSSKSSGSKSSGETFEVQAGSHPFPPGTKVEVFPYLGAELDVREGRTPRGKSAASATVGSDTALKFSGLKKGTYIAVAEIDQAPPDSANPFKQLRPASLTFEVGDPTKGREVIQ